MASKTGVSITKLKAKVKEIIALPYHNVAFTFLEKMKSIDKNLYKIQKEIEELPSLVYKVKNGSQEYQKKHPLLDTYEGELKLYNSTVRELMNYLRSSQQIESRILGNDTSPDRFDEEMKEFDDDFVK